MTIKSLENFLKALNELNQANIDFMNGINLEHFTFNTLYADELIQVQDLINSFSFVTGQPFDKNLLSTPAPDMTIKSLKNLRALTVRCRGFDKNVKIKKCNYQMFQKYLKWQKFLKDVGLCVFSCCLKF